jgi:peroxiredoxin Q/BCP
VCRAQLGRFEARRAELEQAGASLAAVCVDPVETSKALAEKMHLGYPILSDPGGQAVRAWGVEHTGKGIAIPSVFVVAADGTIRWRSISALVTDRPTEDEVLAVVRSLKR